MLLSKKSTFYLVFSVLLVAALAFVVPQAMAVVTVEYTATLTDATDDPAKDGKWEVTFTFTDGGSFVKSNFITGSGDNETVNVSLGGTSVAKDKFKYEGNKLTVGIPHAGANSPDLSFTVTGYNTVSASASVPTATTIDPISDSLHGKAYRVYARVASGNDAPHLPTGVSAVQLTGFPADLEEFFFVGGGTIDLRVTGTAKNSGHIVINEVMWALDNRLVGQAGEAYQQWIEIYNNSSIPVADTAISFVFTNNTSGLNPPPAIAAGISDRLSNIPSRTNTWNVKGQNGASTVDNNDITGANPAFKSMYRNTYKHDITKNEGGWNEEHWSVSEGRVYLAGFHGSPGSVNIRGVVPTERQDPDVFTPPKDSIIINEVGNYEDNTLDWIELRNVGTTTENIKNWRLNSTNGTGDFNETNIVQFADKDTKIAAGEVLLIVNKDPESTDLAAGQDIRESDRANQTFGAGSHKYLNIKRSDGKDLHITDMDKGFLILRSNGDNKFLGGRQHIRDVVGTARVTRNTLSDAAETKEPETTHFWKTEAWPLNGHTGNNYRAHDAKDSSNGNASLHPDANFENGSVWARSGTNHGWRKGGGSHAGYVGGVGYDRGVRGNGTPGYHNDVLKGKTTDLSDGKLVISELMLTTDNGRFPQWIELHNTSRTKGINLSTDGSDPKTGWQMIIENHNSGSWAENERPLVATINLKDFGDIQYIPPNQTVLIVSRTGRHSSGAGSFPTHRIGSVWGTKSVRDALKPKNSRDLMLNAEGGFYIKIVDGDENVTDAIGNLDGKASSRGQGLDEPYSWKWPNDMTEDGNRTSLIRLMDDGEKGVQGKSVGTAGTPRTGVPDRTVDGDMTGAVIPLGTAANRRGKGEVGKGDAAKTHAMNAEYVKAAWVHAYDTAFADARETWYGSITDIGTPLHTTGTPLPVELSHFRPTLENGEVVIRWTTESELDNAGFNILRSDTRDGEYKQVNAELIQGHGTTGERSTYKWVDASAKPGVVYYYQIEDVSFAGERQTLQTTKLKGLISAVGKATTTWGDIKEVQ